MKASQWVLHSPLEVIDANKHSFELSLGGNSRRKDEDVMRMQRIFKPSGFGLGLVLLALTLTACGNGLPADAHAEVDRTMAGLNPGAKYSIDSIQVGKDSSGMYDEVLCVLIKFDDNPTSKRHLAAMRKGSTWQVGYNLIDIGIIFDQYGCKP